MANKMDLYEEVLIMLICINADNAGEFLEELEGDYHTFLHPNFLKILINANLISATVALESLKLRDSIDKISTSKWTEFYFLNDDEWQLIRGHALKIQMLLKI